MTYCNSKSDLFVVFGSCQMFVCLFVVIGGKVSLGICVVVIFECCHLQDGDKESGSDGGQSSSLDAEDAANLAAIMSMTTHHTTPFPPLPASWADDVVVDDVPPSQQCATSPNLDNDFDMLTSALAQATPCVGSLEVDAPISFRPLPLRKRRQLPATFTMPRAPPQSSPGAEGCASEIMDVVGSSVPASPQPGRIETQEHGIEAASLPAAEVRPSAVAAGPLLVRCQALRHSWAHRPAAVAATPPQVEVAVGSVTGALAEVEDGDNEPVRDRTRSKSKSADANSSHSDSPH